MGVTVTVYLLPSSVVIDVLVAAAGGPDGVAGAAVPLPGAAVDAVAPFLAVAVGVFLLLLQAALKTVSSAASTARERIVRKCTDRDPIGARREP